MRLAQRLSCFTVVSLGLLSAGCIHIGSPEIRNFEKDFAVQGPVTLEIQNGSGDVTISAAGSGHVRVKGEVRLYEYLLATGTRRLLDDITSKPPISQNGDILRINRPQITRAGGVSINYTIEVPGNTEVRVRNGSGDVTVQGIEGPVNLETGSGDIEVKSIARRVDISAGSGDISIRDVRGEVVVSARSGGLQLDAVGGDIRARTSSGDIRINHPGGKVQAHASSGDIEIDGVSADLRVETGSGDCQIAGNPPPRAEWHVQTRSGDVTLDVPDRASFQIYAISRSEVDSRLEMTIEEKSRRELRGRVGKGEARVRVETGSGSIRIR